MYLVDPASHCNHVFGKTELLTLYRRTPIAQNTDGSFTLANSISFLSSYVILPTAPENKYLGKISFFIIKFIRIA